MTLFESLKMFPKIDIHIDYFGSILKTTIEKLSNDFLSEEIEDTIDFNSLKDYSDYKSIVSKVLVNLKNIEIATTDLIEKLKKDNVMYGEIFINLDLFSKKLKKKDIILSILKVIKNSNLKVALIYSYGVNGEDGVIDENSESTEALSTDDRTFLENAIKDYNNMFGTNYDTSSERFQNYYKDVSLRMQNKELGMLIVVNMFLQVLMQHTLIHYG